MFSRQPFSDSDAMHAAADEIWWSLKVEDWLEAFSKHPRIGQQSAAKWSAQEQSGMSQAAIETAIEMQRLNTEYFAKFDFIFIVCATGKSAAEMLDLLRTRITNSREEEIRIAAAEQAKITHLRLDKLLAE
jgi:OHCU decarboxylase